MYNLNVLIESDNFHQPPAMRAVDLSMPADWLAVSRGCGGFINRHIFLAVEAPPRIAITIPFQEYAAAFAHIPVNHHVCYFTHDYAANVQSELISQLTAVTRSTL